MHEVKWRQWRNIRNTPPCWRYAQSVSTVVILHTTACKRTHVYDVTLLHSTVYLQHGGVCDYRQNDVTITSRRQENSPKASCSTLCPRGGCNNAGGGPMKPSRALAAGSSASGSQRLRASDHANHTGRLKSNCVQKVSNCKTLTDKQTKLHTDRRRESNLVHFNLKMWHLVAIIFNDFPDN